jgi:hypothetical protein
MSDGGSTVMAEMNLLDVANALDALSKSNTEDSYAKELGFVHLTLRLDQWEAIQRVIAMFQLADLVNYKVAQDSFPRLLNAVKLILAIEENPFQNPDDRIRLAPKTRAQLDSAVKFAENRDRVQ